MKKRALVLGCNGQDGSYMCELLLEKDYDVYGLVRRQSDEKFDNINHILDKITLIHGDLTDQSSLLEALEISNPDEIYNFAAQSLVPISWEQPILTSEITGVGVLVALESVRKYDSKIKFFQAGSSEMFGRVLETPQTEKTAFNPVSPYACAKVFGHMMVRTYRFSYGMFASNAISFNHEGPRRGKEFVTRKISLGVARIKLGLGDKIYLGNLESKRDWSHAKDIVKGIYAIMQHSEPDDFVLCSGETHSIREFLTEAFAIMRVKDWASYVEVDQKFMRPAEVNLLQGDYSKAKKILNWQPTISFKELVREMVESDIKLLEKSLK